MSAIQKNIKNLCGLFLYFMVYTKNISKHSLKAYKTDLQDLFNFNKIPLPEKPHPLPVKNKKELEQAVKLSLEQNMTSHLKLASSSRARKIAVARSFIKWLAEQNYIKEDFRFMFKPPKVSSRLPSCLSVDEVFSVLQALKKEEGQAKKETALFFLLYGGGLRVSEACHLQSKNIDWPSRIIKIKGKGDKERLVCLPKKAIEKIKYLKENQPYLFGHKPLSERKAYDIIKSMGQKAGLLKPLHPHALRHSFATHILLGGGNLRILQELLGHKNLATTQKYTHLDLAHLSKTLERHHPLETKNQ